MSTDLTFTVLQLEQLLPAVRAHFFGAGASSPDFYAESDRPQAPGVYVWCAGADKAVLYIGSAARLARRLGDESRWVKEHRPETHWAPSVVHFLHQRRATPFWLVTDTHADARLLERRLIEWHRTTVGCAPLLTGWAPKPDSDQGTALKWARDLWNIAAAVHHTWDLASQAPAVSA